MDAVKQSKKKEIPALQGRVLEPENRRYDDALDLRAKRLVMSADTRLTGLKAGQAEILKMLKLVLAPTSQAKVS